MDKSGRITIPKFTLRLLQGLLGSGFAGRRDEEVKDSFHFSYDVAFSAFSFIFGRLL